MPKPLATTLFAFLLVCSAYASESNSVSNPESDASLRTLYTRPGRLHPAFESDIKEYTLNVPNHVSHIQVYPIPSLDAATSQISGNDNIGYGKTIITVKVISEDSSSEEIYTIVVNRDRSGGPKIRMAAAGVIVLVVSTMMICICCCRGSNKKMKKSTLASQDSYKEEVQIQIKEGGESSDTNTTLNHPGAKRVSMRRVSYMIQDNSIRQVFDFYDSDKNGHLSGSELTGAVMLCGVHHPTEEKIQALLDKYDTNKSGSLDFIEFSQVIKELQHDSVAVRVSLNLENAQQSIGLGLTQENLIYDIVEGGAAKNQGELRVGDVLLEVDGVNIVGQTVDQWVRNLDKSQKRHQLKVARSQSIISQ